MEFKELFNNNYILQIVQNFAWYLGEVAKIRVEQDNCFIQHTDNKAHFYCRQAGDYILPFSPQHKIMYNAGYGLTTDDK